MTVTTAREYGLPFGDPTARGQLKTIATYIDSWRGRLLQGVGIPGDSDTVSYILLGLAAENYPGDAATDALAHYLKNRQSPDGRWWIFGDVGRPLRPRRASARLWNFHISSLRGGASSPACEPAFQTAYAGFQPSSRAAAITPSCRPDRRDLLDDR